MFSDLNFFGGRKQKSGRRDLAEFRNSKSAKRIQIQDDKTMIAIQAERALMKKKVTLRFRVPCSMLYVICWSANTLSI